MADPRGDIRQRNAYGYCCANVSQNGYNSNRSRSFLFGQCQDFRIKKIFLFHGVRTNCCEFDWISAFSNMV